MPSPRSKRPGRSFARSAGSPPFRRAIMRQSEYEALQRRIDHWRVIEGIAAETGFDPEMLLILYTQKVTRIATKRFYKVKAQSRQLLAAWKSGESLLQISQRVDFPPILTAYQLLMEDRIPRKRFWTYIRDTASIPDKRLRKEVEELLLEDLIYSPEGTEIQHSRGKIGEGRLTEWLDQHGISYLTEDDLRGEHTKTPDVLLHEPLVIDNLEIHWIESKANFGDKVEIRRNLTKQLAPYLSMFGPGLVVYWFGYVYDQPLPEGILITDETLLQQDDIHSLVSHPIGGPPRPIPTEQGSSDHSHEHRGSHRAPRHRPVERSERPIERRPAAAHRRASPQRVTTPRPASADPVRRGASRGKGGPSHEAAPAHTREAEPAPRRPPVRKTRVKKVTRERRKSAHGEGE